MTLKGFGNLHLFIISVFIIIFYEWNQFFDLKQFSLTLTRLQEPKFSSTSLLNKVLSNYEKSIMLSLYQILMQYTGLNNIIFVCKSNDNTLKWKVHFGAFPYIAWRPLNPLSLLFEKLSYCRGFFSFFKSLWWALTLRSSTTFTYLQH